MYCKNCGMDLNGQAAYCSRCGNKAEAAHAGPSASCGTAGFSQRIHDPLFKKYIKKTYRWSALFSLMIAAAAVVGFYIAGENSADFDNPQALYIGFGIGGMFIVIAFIQMLCRMKSKTWDGVVVDKKATIKRRRKYTTNDDFYMEEYMEYTVYIRCDSGKQHTLRSENDDTVFSYYRIGDRVRHHKGLNSYEKYDKSGDTIIFCNACASKNDICEEYCHRCKCPLLK